MIEIGWILNLDVKKIKYEKLEFKFFKLRHQRKNEDIKDSLNYLSRRHIVQSRHELP